METEMTRTEKIEKLSKLIGYTIVEFPLSDEVLAAEIARLEADRSRVAAPAKMAKRHTGGHRTKIQNNFVYMD